MQPISNMLMMILVIGILTYGAIRVMQGSLTMGALISFLMYLFQLMGPVIMVSQFFNELAKTSGSTERIREMLNEPVEESADDQKIDVSGKELRLQNVSFSYEKDKQILHDITCGCILDFDFEAYADSVCVHLALIDDFSFTDHILKLEYSLFKLCLLIFRRVIFGVLRKVSV